MVWRKTGQDQYECGHWLLYKGARKPPGVNHYVTCWHVYSSGGPRAWKDTLAEAQAWCAEQSDP